MPGACPAGVLQRAGLGAGVDTLHHDRVLVLERADDVVVAVGHSGEEGLTRAHGKRPLPLRVPPGVIVSTSSAKNVVAASRSPLLQGVVVRVDQLSKRIAHDGCLLRRLGCCFQLSPGRATAPGVLPFRERPVLTPPPCAEPAGDRPQPRRGLHLTSWRLRIFGVDALEVTIGPVFGAIESARAISRIERPRATSPRITSSRGVSRTADPPGAAGCPAAERTASTAPGSRRPASASVRRWVRAGFVRRRAPRGGAGARSWRGTCPPPRGPARQRERRSGQPR